MKKYVCDYLTKYKSNVKKAWDVDNDIINNKMKIVNCQTKLTQNLTEPETMADYFNKYFTKIGLTFTNKIDSSNAEHF